MSDSTPSAVRVSPCHACGCTVVSPNKRGPKLKYCDECRAEVERAEARRYYRRTLPHRSAEASQRRAEYQKQYRSANAATLAERKAAHYRNDPEAAEGLRRSRREWQRRRWASSPSHRINSNIRVAIAQSLTSGLDGARWEAALGYTVTNLQEHLERQFTDGMTWENYGRNGWHIDHIIPKSWFSYDSMSDPEFLECWALSNLQPLWAHDNQSKGSRFASVPNLPE